MDESIIKEIDKQMNSEYIIKEIFDTLINKQMNKEINRCVEVQMNR